MLLVQVLQGATDYRQDEHEGVWLIVVEAFSINRTSKTVASNSHRETNQLVKSSNGNA